MLYIDYTPRGSRIPVFSVKGKCPGPLDDGGLMIYLYESTLKVVVYVNKLVN